MISGGVQLVTHWSDCARYVEKHDVHTDRDKQVLHPFGHNAHIDPWIKVPSGHTCVHVPEYK